MNGTELITKRRSIRKYTDEVVSKEVLTAIMEEAKFTQSWKNLQIARFTFVQDADTIEKIAKDGVNDFIYNTKTLQKAKNVLVLSFVKGKSGKLSDDDTDYATSKGNEWEVFDAGIACQTFCLSACNHGVGTCVMGIIDDKSIAEIVNLPEDETVAALITFGIPAEEGRPTSRLTVDELCRFI